MSNTAKAPEKKYKLAIFDFDGTIADTIDCSVESFQQMLEHYDLDRMSVKTVKKHFNSDPQQMIQELMYDPTYPPDFYERAAFRFYSLYSTLMVDYTKLFRGFKKVFKTFEDAGIQLAVASNQVYELTSENLHILEVGDYFDFVIASDQVENPKPHPDMAEQLMLATGIDPAQILIIGDEPRDILMGKSIGAVTVGVTWGYGSEEELAEVKPDYLFSKVTDLEDLINS